MQNFKNSILSFIIILGSSCFSHAAVETLADAGVTDGELLEVVEKYGYSLDTPIRHVLEDTRSSREMTTEESNFRGALYGGLFNTIRNTNDIEQAQKLTELVLIGINTSKRTHVYERLSTPPFEADYFNEDAKQYILNKKSGRDSRYIRLLGVADIDHPDMDLKAISKKELPKDDPAGLAFFSKYTNPTYAAQLVLARRGDPEALEMILARVEAMEDEMELRANSQLIKDLGFVRQPDAVDALIKILFSDLGYPENPYPEFIQNHLPTPMPFAASAVKPLSIALEGLPYVHSQANVTWDHIDQFREFIKDYKGPWRFKGDDNTLPSEPEMEVIAEVVEPEVEENVIQTVPPEPKASKIAQIEPEPEKSLWWPWVLVGLIILVGFIWLILRKRDQRNLDNPLSK